MDNSEKFDSGLAWNAAITTAVTVTVVAIRAKFVIFLGNK
jgi:hypothetical protein